MRLSLLIGFVMCSLFLKTTHAKDSSRIIPASSRIVAAQEKAKKVIMFTSKGGYGHMAACATLKNILTDYEVSIVNPFETILTSLDVVKKITWGRYDCEQFYNSLLSNGWIRFMNFFCHRPAFYLVHRSRKQIEQKMWRFLRQEKPDLLISTIPLINYPTSCAAQNLNIPFLLVTLDADLTKWLLDMDQCTHPNFMLTVGTKTPLISGQLAAKKIPDASIREIGNPFRQDFFEAKDKDVILHEWCIPSNKPIAMLIRGGAGSYQLINYVKTLLAYGKPLHLLVCVGRNAKLAKQLNSLRKREGLVTFSIIPFTTRISDLMFVSDLLITQPSPNTCNEAMHFGIPILIDKTSPTLFWEDATADLVAMNGIGTTFQRMRDLNLLVKKYLGKKSLARNKVNNRPSFDVVIKQIVYDMTNTPTRSVVKSPDSNVIDPAKAGKCNPKIGKSIAEQGQGDPHDRQQASNHTNIDTYGK